MKSFLLHNKSSHFSLFVCCGSDFPMQLIASDMVSKLYNLCVETSKRDDDSVDLCDEDAVAYAR